MTPEERLAAALDMDTRRFWSDTHIFPDGSKLAEFDHLAYAAAILATDPTLADDLALAAAVNGLPPGRFFSIGTPLEPGGDWRVEPDHGHVAYGPTLTAAIEGATR